MNAIPLLERTLDVDGHEFAPPHLWGGIFGPVAERLADVCAPMIKAMGADYIRTAHAKGLSTRDVLTGHALRNAAVPIVTVIGIGVALLIGGVVITESVFAIPGLGRLTVDAILRRDYPVIQGIILVFSGAYVVVNLAVDMLYTVLDPRIRY